MQAELACLAQQGAMWSPQASRAPAVEPGPLDAAYEAQSDSSDAYEGWPPGLELPERPCLASTELHALAGHLLAADALAARVVELERYVGTVAAPKPRAPDLCGVRMGSPRP